MYHLVYKITCLVNSKFYIGVHSTEDIDDGYMGSGLLVRYAIKKYGLDSFKRDILDICSTREIALNKEAKYVNEKTLNNPLCYNICLGGGGMNKIHKERQILYKNAPKAILAPHLRFNQSIRYEFVVNNDGVKEWEQSMYTRKVHIKKQHEFGLKITKLLIDSYPKLMLTLSDLYNSKKENKHAAKLIQKLHQKNLTGTFSVVGKSWDEYLIPQLGI